MNRKFWKDIHQCGYSGRGLRLDDHVGFEFSLFSLIVFMTSIFNYYLYNYEAIHLKTQVKTFLSPSIVVRQWLYNTLPGTKEATCYMRVDCIHSW